MKQICAAFLCLFALSAPAVEKIQVYFSPDGGCTAAVIENLGHAKSNIWVQAHRRDKFDTDRQRVEFLFALYEKLSAPLCPSVKPRRPQHGNTK